MLTKELVKKAFLVVANQGDFKEGPLSDVYFDLLPETLKKLGIVRGSEEALARDENYLDYVASWYVDSVVTDQLVKYLNDNLKWYNVVEFFQNSFEAFCIDSIYNSVRKDFPLVYRDFVPVIGGQRAVLLGTDTYSGMGNVSCYGRYGDLWDFDYGYGSYNTYLLECGQIVAVQESFYGFVDKSGKENNMLIRSLIPDASDVFLSLNMLDEVVPEEFRDLFDN